MSIIVQKFGGSSVADINCIKGVAEIAKKEMENGNQVVVIVSAMFGTTDNLLQMCENIKPPIDSQSASEYDVVISSGEQVTAGLLSLAIQSIGVKSVSMSNWQIQLKTDSNYTKSRILAVDNVDEIKKNLNLGKIVVIPGFQGVSQENRSTTLGRGGSDTSAIAIAISLGAERCDIYKDVKGVFTADPRVCKNAKKIDKLSHEEMLELSSTGSKVLQTRAVEIAMRHNFDINVRSTFDLSDKGTIISGRFSESNNVVSGISHTTKEAMFTISEIENFNQFLSVFLQNLKEKNIGIDMIVTNEYEKDGKTLNDLTFSVLQSELSRLELATSQASKIFKFNSNVNKDVVKISIVGLKMEKEHGVASRMFSALLKHKIDILAISTSSIKVSVLTPSYFCELALRIIHDEFF